MNQSRQMIRDLREAGFVDLETETSVVMNHKHYIFIPADEIRHSGTMAQTTPADDGHMHIIELSGPDLVSIETGEEFTTETSEDADHHHTVTFHVTQFNSVM